MADDDWGMPGQPKRGAGAVPYLVQNPEYVAAPLDLTDPIALGSKEPPPRRWIVPHWVPHGQVTMLAGDGGIGKTLLAQQLMVSCATGKPWLGLDVEPCRVLGIFCEDENSEIWRRQIAINDSYMTGMGDLENMKWTSRVCEDNALVAWPNQWEPGETQPLFQAVHNAASDFGAQLIVFDSLHDLFGGNENSRPHARQFINALRTLARDIDGAVFLTAHPSLSGRMSGTGEAGSTAWNNAVRSRLYLQRPKDDGGWNLDENTRILTRMKSNYAKSGDEIKLTWADHVLTAEQPESGLETMSRQHRAERVFMQQLAAAVEAGRHISDGASAKNYGPKIFSMGPESEGLSKRDFEIAMEMLFRKGQISVQSYGPPSRGFTQLVVRNAD